MRKIRLTALALSFGLGLFPVSADEGPFSPALPPSGLPEAAEARASQYPFGFSLDLNYEYRLAPEGQFLIEPGKHKNGLDLMRDYLDRLPFAKLSFEYGGTEGLALALDWTFRAQWSGDYGKADNLPGSGEGEPLAIDNFFISRGLLSYSRGDSFLALGRDKPAYDGILYGSLLPGRRLPYLDSLRARARMGSFAIDWMGATIQALRNWECAAYSDASYDVAPNEGAAGAYYGFETDAEPSTIVEVLTRFSWERGSFIFGITDHAMLARRNNRFYLTDFLPVSSRHQTAVAQTNNSMVLDLTFRPFEGLAIRGEAGFDDISAEIFGVSDTSSPTIDAYVLGAEYRGGDAAGTVDAALELGYTQYPWGNYDGTEIQPNDVNPFLRFQYRYLIDSGDAMLLPLSSPYGPGALWLSASGGYEFRGTGLRLGLELFLLSKNEEANLVSTEVLGNTSTAGAPRFFFSSLSLPIRYRIGPWELGATPALLVREGLFRPEATLSARCLLRTGSAKPAP